MGSCLGLMGSALLTVRGPYGALLRCVALVWGSATRLFEWDASVLPVGSGVISGVMPVAFCPFTPLPTDPFYNRKLYSKELQRNPDEYVVSFSNVVST